MIKLLKGDSSTHLVDINIPEAALESGAMLEFMCGDMCRAFPAMPRIELKFDGKWTAAQSPGRMLARWTLVTSEGDRATLTNTYPIYVTIDAAEVGTAGSVSAPVVPTVDLSDLEELSGESTPGDTKALVNEILNRLRSACIGVAIALTSLCTLAATIATSPLDSVPGNEHVVTNVVFDGLATADDLNAKRDKTDLAEYVLTDWRITAVSEGEDIANYTIDLMYDVYWLITYKGLLCGQIPLTHSGTDFICSAQVTDDPNADYPVFRQVFITCRRDLIKTGDRLATTSTVTNIARSVVNTVWDAKLGVAWEARMHDGALYYVAVTNRQEVAE